MREIANTLFDEPDTGLFVFAVGHLDWMLRRFKERYYAVEFPISDWRDQRADNNRGAGSGPRLFGNPDLTARAYPGTFL